MSPILHVREFQWSNGMKEVTGAERKMKSCYKVGYDASSNILTWSRGSQCLREGISACRQQNSRQSSLAGRKQRTHKQICAEHHRGLMWAEAGDLPVETQGRHLIRHLCSDAPTPD